ncbi:MAG: AMP-binding protein [Actinobacteria bacterium]|nr:AMP-binding protein [Actinomycetota bacterium]
MPDARLPTPFDPGPLVRRAVALLRRTGLRTGDRLLTLLPNSPATFAVQLAAMLEGIVQVPLPPDLAAGEVATIAGDADPRAALVDVGARGRSALAALGLPVTVLDEDALAAAGPPAEPAHAWPVTRPMAYTSGTTGRRKGVTVGVSDERWGRVVVDDEHDAFDRRHGDLHLVVSPLYHSGPFRFGFVTALLGGRVAVLPSFDARRWLDTLREVRPTSVFCVPTQLHRLLALPDVTADDLSSLTLLAHAAAPMPVPLKERLLELAPAGSVFEFYGSTEGQFTVAPPDVWRGAPGTVGRARPGRQLEIRDDGGRALETGAVGTVWVRAPDHARWEYWRDPVRTRDVWDGDAFTVGDLGHLDGDGRLFLDGRPGDLVISGGVNVYPAEVERSLLADASIAEAVVFGVPDEEWGERVVAAVVPHAGHTPDPDELRERLRGELAPAKVPKRIVVVDDLPRTGTGKVRRVGLADALGLLA